MLSGPRSASGAACSENRAPADYGQNIWSIGDRVVAFGASEGHEFRGFPLLMECAAWVRVLLHYLAVPQALFSVSGEAFPCILEERELGVQLALDEDALATIDFRGW